MCVLRSGPLKVFPGAAFTTAGGIIQPRHFDVKWEFNTTPPQKMLVIRIAVFLVVRLGKLGNEEAFKASLSALKGSLRDSDTQVNKSLTFIFLLRFPLRTESVAEKMLTNWFTFLLYKFLKVRWRNWNELLYFCVSWTMLKKIYQLKVVCWSYAGQSGLVYRF